MKKKFLLFLFFTKSLSARTIVSVKDFGDSSVAQLRAYYQKNPGGFTVQVEPNNYLIHNAIGWGEWFMGITNLAEKKHDSWFSIKPFVHWALGGTCVTYGAGLYLIYRAYRLLKKMNSWTNWAGKEEEEEIVLYIRGKSKQKHKKCLSQIRSELRILCDYIYFHTVAQKYKIRWMFPQNKAYDHYIKQRVVRLRLLEEKLKKLFE